MRLAGGTALDAVALHGGRGSAVREGAMLVTDSRGLPIEPRRRCSTAPCSGGPESRPRRRRPRGSLRRMTAPLDRELLRLLPKAELHCHLDGSLRPETMIELGREPESRCPLPMRIATRVHARRRCRHLEDYLERFAITLSVMQTESSLERVAFELAEDAAVDGVRYLEVRYAPVLNTREGLTLEQAVEAPLRGLARAEREHGVVGRVIVCSLRHMPLSVSQELAELAVAYRHHGVVGFDLAGGEAGNPARAHAPAFEYARSHDLPCTCHAGEGDDASLRARGDPRVLARIARGTLLG